MTLETNRPASTPRAETAGLSSRDGHIRVHGLAQSLVQRLLESHKLVELLLERGDCESTRRKRRKEGGDFRLSKYKRCTLPHKVAEP